MRHHDNLDIGVATHTGRVRSNNEDDYLVFVPQSSESVESEGCLFVIADGMGGMSGGSEASRAAVRAMASAFQKFAVQGEWNGDDATRRRLLGKCFDAAATEVHRQATENLGLRDMGTTLTVANLAQGRLHVGHVGDTRCLLIRNGVLEQLTEDHAVRSPDNYLTRCIGAGQETVEADLDTRAIAAGDRILLLSDGAWSTVNEATLERIVTSLPAQAATEEIVTVANQAGGPDNITAVLVHVREPSPAGGSELRDTPLPREEREQPMFFAGRGRSLMPPRWPYVLLVLAVLLIGFAAARWLFGFDLLQALSPD